MLDLVRNRVVTRSAGFLDQHLSCRRASGGHPSARCWPASRAPEPVRDLDQIRGFLTGQGPIAIVDLPWIPIFLLICVLIHPWLGMLALVGGLMLASATLLTEWASRGAGPRSEQIAQTRSTIFKPTAAMPKRPPRWACNGAVRRWLALNAGYLAAIERSSDVIGFYASLSKDTRMMLQSAALGLGAYLVIRQS